MKIHLRNTQSRSSRGGRATALAASFGLAAALVVSISPVQAIEPISGSGNLAKWGNAPGDPIPTTGGPWKSFAVSAGGDVIAIKENGTLDTITTAPAAAPVGQQVLAVAAGSSTTRGVVMADGSVRLWGDNRGVGAGSPIFTPDQLDPCETDPVNPCPSGSVKATQVAVGGTMALMLLEDGRVGMKISSGYEIVGALGGDQLTGATQIMANAQTGYVLRNDGSVSVVTASADPLVVVEGDAEDPVENISFGIGVRRSGEMVRFGETAGSAVTADFVPDLPGKNVQAQSAGNGRCAVRTDAGYVGVWRCGGSEGPLDPTDPTDASLYVPADLQGRVLSLEQFAFISAHDANFVALRSDVQPPLIVDTKPVISGVAQQGETLTGTAGQFYGVPEEVTSQWYADGVAIAGATAGTYTLTAAEVTKTITYQTTASRSGSADVVSTSDPTAAVEAITFTVTNLTAPSITGTAKVGSTLAAVDGTWDPSDVLLARQWLRNGVVIPGATTGSYTPVPADLGKTISVRVTATKTDHVRATVVSAETAAVLDADIAVSSPAQISGTAKVGSVITGTPAIFAGNPTTMAHEFLADGVVIAVETEITSYVLTEAQVGKTITYRSTGSRDGETPVVSTSAELGPVIAAGIPLSITTAATATGVAKVGEVVTGVPATFAGSPAPTVANAWLANGAPIAGETSTTYTLKPSDAGKSITFRSTATQGASTLPSVSNAIGPVLVVLTATSPAAASGTAQQTKTLTGVRAVFSDPAAVVANQWLADGVAIPGATGLTYTLQAAEVGKTITFRSTATRGTDTASSVSAGLGPVTAYVKTTPTVAIAAAAGTYGKATTVTVSVSGGATGSVSLTAAGKSFGAAAIVGGAGTFSIPATTAAGSQALAASYAGSDLHTAASTTGTLTIAKGAAKKPTFKANKASTSKKKGKATVTVATNGGLAKAAGKATVTLKSGKTTKKITVKLSGGKASLSLPKLKKGTWKVTVAYNGDVNYKKGASKSYKLKIKK